MAVSQLTKRESTNLNLMLQRQYNIMKRGGKPSLPQKIGSSDFDDDFANFYGATENIMNGSGTGVQSDSQNMYELHFLCNKRLGVGNAITQGFAEDALFNWFNPKKVDTKNTLVTVPGFNKWCVETDFKNQSIIWDTHKRTYGIGLLVKFWTNKDVESGRINTPAPKKPPKKFQVLSPLYLAPTNTHETSGLTYDEDIWKFMGGNLKTTSIHRSRIEVIRGAPQPDSYRGLSVPETIYLPLICYYNALIYFTKAMSKFGQMTPVLKSGSVTPTPDEYTEFLTLMEEFVANGFFFLGKDDSIEYPTTNIGQGLYQSVELLKEEIAAGTRIPLNQLFGRSESGGIAGTGNLTAERKYLNNLANEQMKISDDFLRIFTHAGFDFEGKDLYWNLALQKTREQQLQEESMELNNGILKQQLRMMRKENTMMKAQQELFDEHKHEFTAEQQLESAEKIKEDFNHRNTRFDDFMRMQNILSGGKK